MRRAGSRMYLSDFPADVRTDPPGCAGFGDRCV